MSILSAMPVVCVVLWTIVPVTLVEWVLQPTLGSSHGGGLGSLQFSERGMPQCCTIGYKHSMPVSHENRLCGGAAVLVAANRTCQSIIHGDESGIKERYMSSCTITCS